MGVWVFVRASVGVCVCACVCMWIQIAIRGAFSSSDLFPFLARRRRGLAWRCSFRVYALRMRACATHAFVRWHAYVCVCCHTCLERAGFLALFKGMAAPLVSASLVNAITFGAYAQSQRVSCIIFCYQLRQLP